jgi:hypothetical protein
MHNEVAALPRVHQIEKLLGYTCHVMIMTCTRIVRWGGYIMMCIGRGYWLHFLLQGDFPDFPTQDPSQVLTYDALATAASKTTAKAIEGAT